MQRRTFLNALGLGIAGAGTGWPDLAPASAASEPELELILGGIDLSRFRAPEDPIRIEVAGVGVRGSRMARALAFGNHLPAVSQFHFFEGRVGEAGAQDLDFENTWVLAIVSDLQTPRTRQLCLGIAEEARERGVPTCVTLVSTPAARHDVLDEEMTVSAFIESAPYLGRTIAMARGLDPALHLLRGLTDAMSSRLELISPTSFPGLVMTDIHKIQSILFGTGAALFGFGQASGSTDSRAATATLAALRALEAQQSKSTIADWVVALQGNEKTLDWKDVGGLMRALGPSVFEHDEPDLSALFNNALPDGVITVSIIAVEPTA